VKNIQNNTEEKQTVVTYIWEIYMGGRYKPNKKITGKKL
jgi:hypothetical protein